MQPHINPYDFLEKQSHSPRFGGASKKSLALFFGGIVLLIVIIIVVATAFLRSGDSAETALRAVAIRQSEITSLTSITEVRDSTGGAVKAAVSTINLSVQSDNTKLLSAVQARGIKWGEKELATSTIAKNESQIDTAIAAGTLDDTVTSILATSLSSYRDALSSAFQQTNNAEIKQQLQASYDNTELLVQQLEAAR